MSLLDLVPVLLASKMKRKPRTHAEAKADWQKRNRAKVNATRQQWRQRRRAEGKAA